MLEPDEDIDGFIAQLAVDALTDVPADPDERNNLAKTCPGRARVLALRGILGSTRLPLR